MVQVSFQQIGIAGRTSSCIGDEATVSAVYQAADKLLGGTPHSFKLVHKGATLPADKPGLVLSLQDGDVFVIVPQRHVPSERVVAAVTHARGGAGASSSGRGGHHGGGAGDDDADECHLPAGAPAWEHAVVSLLRTRARCPDYVLEWVVWIRPWRLAVAVAYLALWILLAKLSLGPVFTLATIVAVIFCNLGTRKPGEASAYSIFNDGVRLPGQLDANEVDRQIREGQGLVR